MVATNAQSVCAVASLAVLELETLSSRFDVVVVGYGLSGVRRGQAENTAEVECGELHLHICVHVRN